MSAEQIIKLTEDHRDQLGSARKFPAGAPDCIFAIEEAGELYDAWIRLDASYQRNHAKEIDPSTEAADLMYMIASAIIAIRRGNIGDVQPREVTLAEILERVIYALIALYRDTPNGALNNLEYALKHCLDLCAREHWNPVELINAKIARDNARYLPVIPTNQTANNGSLNHDHGSTVIDR